MPLDQLSKSAEKGSMSRVLREKGIFSGADIKLREPTERNDWLPLVGIHCRTLNQLERNQLSPFYAPGHERTMNDVMAAIVAGLGVVAIFAWIMAVSR